jgi:hypothetical protein
MRHPQGGLICCLLSYINVLMPACHSDNISTQIVYTATWEKFPRIVMTI